MPVIIDDQHTVHFVLKLKTAMRASETAQGFGDPFKRNFQLEADGDCGQRVEDVVHAGNAQLDFTHHLDTAPNDKSGAKLAVVTNTVGGDVRLRAEAVSNSAPLNTWNNCLHVGIVKTKNRGAVEGNLVHKICEAHTHVFHVVVIVHVLAVDVCYDGNRRC